jgi:catechol 2,3-dioxygenase
VSEAIYLDDPDGNGLEIYRDRPRSEWTWKDGHVMMAVDPLDIDAIVATVPDPNAPFAGMAEGTRVGHVHLRVGALDQAEAFYHGLLGFDIVARVPGALFVSAGGYHHHIGLNTWQSRGAPRPPADAAGLREFVIVLPEAQARDQLAARLEGAAVPFERQGADLLADDPWGNRLRVAPEAQ